LGDHPQIVIPPSRSSPKPLGAIFVSGKEKMDGMDPIKPKINVDKYGLLF